MSDTRISFDKRTFSEIRDELISFVETYYPEVLSDFTDSSLGQMLIDLNAAVGNNLAINTDRNFVETQLEYAQQRSSILNLARNLGFNIPGRRPSVTVCDFTVTVPVRGDQPDTSYYPILSRGSQVIGGGKVFETTDVIDWNSPISSLGDSNRRIVPNTDSNGILQSYDVTKREVVINGSTNIFKRVIRESDVQPFFSITLPDQDIINIDRVILKPGTNFTTDPNNSDFTNPDLIYYPVDYLAQQKVFIEDQNSGSNTQTTGSTGIKAGRWIYTTKKFIKEYTDNGFCKLTFGSGDSETDAFVSGFLKQGVTNQQFLRTYLENTALGERLKKDHTLYVRYKVGGGLNSNVGARTLTQLGNFNLSVNGSRQDLNNEVRRSFTTSNPIAAIGGNDGLNINQIRYLIKYNFSSQNRDVTITDYLTQVYKIPGKFGSPYKASSFRENNKIVIPIIGLGSDGKLNNTSNTLLKNNIAEYLTGFRMVNDYIEIRDGRIFNLAFDIEVFVANESENDISNNIINTVRSYLTVSTQEMNTDIFLGKLETQISNLNNVNNVLGIKVYNKTGGQYSPNVVEQELISEETGQIKLINNTIYSTEDSIFEIKYPQKDIRVFLKKKTDLFK